MRVLAVRGRGEPARNVTKGRLTASFLVATGPCFGETPPSVSTCRALAGPVAT